jgi:glutamine amidotransferase
MGWNLVEIMKDNPLFTDMYVNPHFYFVHSYHVVCSNASDVLTSSDYGFKFTSSFAIDNIIGAQFHAEKSYKFGMCLLRNFIERI